MSYRYAVPQDNYGQLEKLAGQENEIALRKAMQPSTGQQLIGAAAGIGHSLIDYDRGRKKREMDERGELAERVISRNDYEFDINQLNNWVMTGQGLDGSNEIPVKKVVKEEKPQKPLAPHYGPVYGRGGKYYQSVFQMGPDGKPTPGELELGGEPMQISAQKQAVLARYADDERRAAQDEYERLKTHAAVQAALYPDDPVKAAAAYNADMKANSKKLKNPRIRQAVMELWGTETTPLQGSGGQPEGINPMTGKPYGQEY